MSQLSPIYRYNDTLIPRQSQVQNLADTVKYYV